MKTNNMRRSTAPILIVLAAVLIYAGQDTLLAPLKSAPLAADHAQLDNAGVQAENLSEGAATVASSDVKNLDPVSAVPREVPNEGKIRKNSSLYVELREMGITPQEIDRVVRATKGTYNLKRVRPGQRFDVYNTSGQLDSLAFYINKEQHLFVRRDGTTFAAEIESIPHSKTYHVTHGTITHSIFASLKSQGAETELASALDEIFGWTIDFINDTRRGDSYVILYERKTYYDGSTSIGEVLAAKVNNQGNEHHAFRYGPEGTSVGYYDAEGKSLQKSLRRSPLKFTRVTSNFTGRRFHPVYKTYRPHYGVDFGAPRGTPVYATGDGVVLTASRRRGNGNYVKIKHNNTYTTYYLHLNGFARGMKSGKRVKQGQLIGYVGSTGAATASHVCYRIKRNGSWVNPRKLALPSKAPVPDAEVVKYEHQRDMFMNRIDESLRRGLENNTIAVDQPSSPYDARVRAMF